MKTAILLSLFLCLAAVPATAGSASSQQGEASTANALFQWNVAPFSVKSKKKVQLGKTGTLTCAAAKGCVVHTEIEVNLQPEATGAFVIYAHVDQDIDNPGAVGVTCDAGDFCSASVPGTLVVTKGAHQIQYFLETSFAGTLASWSGQAQLYQ